MQNASPLLRVDADPHDDTYQLEDAGVLLVVTIVLLVVSQLRVQRRDI